MSLPRVEQDSETGYAYVYLCEPASGLVADTIALKKEDPEDPNALDALVLDFDASGRLVGIEVLGRAEGTLRPEVLAHAKRI